MGCRIVINKPTDKRKQFQCRHVFYLLFVIPFISLGSRSSRNQLNVKNCTYSKPSTPKRRKTLAISDPENMHEKQSQASPTMARFLERYKDLEKSLLHNANEIQPDLVRFSSVLVIDNHSAVFFSAFSCNGHIYNF